jgi:hypothetical protein
MTLEPDSEVYVGDFEHDGYQGKFGEAHRDDGDGF